MTCPLQYWAETCGHWEKKLPLLREAATRQGTGTHFRAVTMQLHWTGRNPARG